jgi:site-specific DNA recombinase
MENKKRVGIWVRVSTEFQVKDDSPQHHEKRARLYAEAKGWEVIELYQLDAVSGKSVMEQPETKRMLKDLRSGRISGLIFSKLARLARNTKELLEFSEIFRTHEADLVSLSESIDTSSSAGRLFYTMIAALSEWERSEIAERVAASVPVRAKLGKSLGGQSPYGYKWVGKELVINEEEAPVRKLMYDLFTEHKRKATVADLLNQKGYRTRNGSPFSDTTIGRLLRDPIAKGQRRANYTKSLGANKKWVVKPESEWVVTACPALVTEEIWNSCNSILDQQEMKRTPKARKSTHLFAGILRCHCGGKMYIPSRTEKYTCSVCKKTRIAKEDMESIYYEQLKSFLLTKKDISTFVARADSAIQSKQAQLEAFIKDRNRIKIELDKLIQLHLKDRLTPERFTEYYNPLELQLKQIEEAIPEIEAQLDFIKVQQLNGDHILENAENLYDRWPQLELEAKRQIVEELTEAVIINNEEISIKFCYSPSFLPNPPTSPHNVMDSSR